MEIPTDGRTDEPSRPALIKLKFLLYSYLVRVYLINYRTSDYIFVLPELVRCRRRPNSKVFQFLPCFRPICFLSHSFHCSSSLPQFYGWFSFYYVWCLIHIIDNIHVTFCLFWCNLKLKIRVSTALNWIQSLVGACHPSQYVCMAFLKSLATKHRICLQRTDIV